MQKIDVEVKNIELAGASANVMKHRKVCCDVASQRRRIEAQRTTAAWNELRSSLRIATREQRYMVALCYERFSENGDDAFGSTVQARRHRLAKWSNQGNFERGDGVVHDFSWMMRRPQWVDRQEVA